MLYSEELAQVGKISAELGCFSWTSDQYRRDIFDFILASQKDIRSVYQLQPPPVAAAFDDYSLRHPTTGERVADAVKDSFGDGPIRYIGARMDGTGTSPYGTKERPSEDGHWCEVPGSEGAIVLLPERLL
jgi:hypothetical protein